MGSLADAVLPLVRTRTDLHRWSAANSYGHGVHQAVALLQHAAQTQPAAEVLPVTQRALATALKAIARADDSSGIIGDAVKDLLALHADLTNAAPPPPARLVAWMIDFQFDGVVDYFTLDPAAYGPALGDRGGGRARGSPARPSPGRRPPPAVLRAGSTDLRSSCRSWFRSWV